MLGQTNRFHVKSVIKKLPTDARVAQVAEEADCIRLVSNPRVAPSWHKITAQKDIEEWLLRQNKTHHQQVYRDGSPHVTGAVGRMFESFNDLDTLHKYLE